MPPSCAQTIKQAKAAYKKSSDRPKLSEQERKRYARDATLQERADREREKESRRQWAIKQKAKKEEQQKDLRRQQGIGLATQLAGYSHTQKQMKSAMEGFLRKTHIVAAAEPESANAESGREGRASYLETEDFDIDSELLDEELGRCEQSVAAVQEGDVFAMPELVQISHPSPQRRGPFQASQSFGESLDDESLMEAESLVAPFATNMAASPNIPRKRSCSAMLDQAHHTNLSISVAAPSAVQCVRNMPRPMTVSRRTPQSWVTIDDATEAEIQVALADLLPTNTQVAKELIPPTIVSSRSLLATSGAVHTPQPYNRTKSAPAASWNQKRANATTSERKRPSTTAVDSGAVSMLPPPRPCQPKALPKWSPKRSTTHHTSAFSDFGLSTQMVHAVLDDDFDLTDEETDKLRAKPEPTLLAEDFENQELADSDFDLDTDFG